MLNLSIFVDFAWVLCNNIGGGGKKRGVKKMGAIGKLGGLMGGGGGGGLGGGIGDMIKNKIAN